MPRTSPRAAPDLVEQRREALVHGREHHFRALADLQVEGRLGERRAREVGHDQT